MKKLILLVGGLIVLLVVGAVIAFVYLDVIVKKGVEKVGPAITKVDVQVKNVSVSPFSGKGKLEGLLVGNPPEFKTSSAIQMGGVAVELVPGSVMSDKIIVRSINITAPEITFEGTPQGSNLGKILDNVQGTNAKDAPASKEEHKAKTRKLQVDALNITGGRVRVSTTILAGKAASVPLPDIHLANLGQGPEGITPAELTERVLRAVVEGTVKSVGASIGNIGEALGGSVKALGTNAVGSALQDVGNLLKRK